MQTIGHIFHALQLGPHFDCICRTLAEGGEFASEDKSSQLPAGYPHGPSAINIHFRLGRRMPLHASRGFSGLYYPEGPCTHVVYTRASK